MADQPLQRYELLARCALLYCFDRATLSLVAGCGPHEAEQLVAAETSEPWAWGYRLRAEVAAPALARLRAEQPGAETAFHQAACSFYLERLARTAAGGREPTDEDCCLHHLDALFIQLGAQMQWQRLLDLSAQIAATRLLQLRHTRRLTMMEGYIAGRTQRYEVCEALLTSLLAEAELEPDVRAKALKGLADAALQRSQYERALELYDQLSVVAADDPIYQGLALLNSASALHELEHHDQALERCVRSRELFHRHGDRVREAHACYHAAIYSLYLGRWEQAEQLRAAAADLFERLQLPGYLGFSYWMKGYLRHIFGQIDASEAAYLQALPLAESPEFGQPSLAMDTWLYLGFLYASQARWDEALSHYSRAEALALQLDRRHALSTIAFRRGQIYERQGRLAEAGEAYGQALAGVEALRSETASQEVKISLLGTTRQMYEAMVLLCLARGQEAEAFHTVERARSRAFLDLLTQHNSSPPQRIERQVVTVAEIQAQLPPGALLIEYFTIGVLPRGEHLLNRIPPEQAGLLAQLTFPPQVLLFAIDKQRLLVRHLALDPNLLRPQPGDRFPGRHLLHGRLPHYLYEQLIAPAAPLTADKDTVYLIPHGPLHYVPFSALRDGPSSYWLRAGGPALAQAPSATVLLRTCLGRPPATGTHLLALGFNDADGPRPLRFAEAEARLIADIFQGEAWVGPEPKSQRLLAPTSQPRWLHIAGHARFEPADPLASSLHLGQDDSLSARAIMGELQLSVDLVSLSSCMSGQSHVVQGDELLGLQRALLYAGAPAVICARWEAYDLVALLVMRFFYDGVRAGLPAARALCTAQLTVRELSAAALTKLLESWSAEWPFFAAELAEATDAAAKGPEQPFADPLLWAPFMLIGRAG